MSGFALVAAIIGAFFTAGTVLGILLVALLPQFRRRRDGRGYPHPGYWLPPPDTRGDDDRPPRWPLD